MKRTALSLLSLALLGSTALAQQVTIKINGYGGTDPAIVGDLINKFVKPIVAKDNINVVYEPLQGDYNKALTTLLAAGNAGDLLYLPGETAGGFIATGKLLPLNGLVSTTPFIKSLNSVFTVKGQTYAIAKDFNTLSLVYNKDLFDEAKVAYPNANDTWKSLAVKLASVKKALPSGYYGICLQPGFDRFGAFAYAEGWKQFDAAGKTNLLSKPFVDAFTWYTSLAKDKVGVTPSEISQGWTGGCMQTGKVAVAIEGNWVAGFLKDNAPNLKYGSTLLPKADATGKRGNFLYTVGWAVNSGTKNKAAALKVLNALTSVDAQNYVLSEGLAIPQPHRPPEQPFFTKSGAGSENAKVVFQGATDGFVTGFNFGPAGADWSKIVDTALASVLSGQKSVKDALASAQSDMNKLQSR